MDGFTRYALYYAPRSGPLAEFGAAWLGWDPTLGRRVAHPVLPGLKRPVAAFTAQAGRYGLHATLKAPFHLADGFDVSELHMATEALASALPPVLIDGLRLGRLGRFLALLPEGDTTELALLAARVVEALDAFRAPTEIGEALRPGLSARQAELQRRWGYPWVMEEYRFHMTLTDPVPEAEAEQVSQALAPVLERVLPQPLRLRDICLFGEGQDGRFRLLNRYPLEG